MAVSHVVDRPLRRFTVEDYHRMLEAGILTEDDRVELIRGEVVEMTPIGAFHASHVKRLASKFRGLEPDQAIVSVQDPIRLPPDSQPEPDIALLKPREDFYGNAHPTADDVFLVVEVAVTSVDFDRKTKIPLYAEHGVPVVWLVDLESRRLEIYEEPIDGDYTIIRKPPMDRTMAVPGGDGLKLTVGDCFIDA